MIKRLEIISDIENLHEVETFCKDIFKEMNFSRKVYCKMYLATVEGVNNAIIHGNENDINKLVKVTFENKKKHLEIKIEDEGKGFDYRNIPNPTLKQNIRVESGRGVFIMKQYADKVDFMNDGSKVNLIFNKE